MIPGDSDRWMNGGKTEARCRRASAEPAIVGSTLVKRRRCSSSVLSATEEQGAFPSASALKLGSFL